MDGFLSRIRRRLERVAVLLYPPNADVKPGGGVRVALALPIIALSAVVCDRASLSLASRLVPIWGAALPAWTLIASGAAAVAAAIPCVRGLGARRGAAVAAGVGLAAWTLFPYSAWQVVPTIRVALGAVWLALASALLWRAAPALASRAAGWLDHARTVRATWLIGALALFAATAAGFIALGAFDGCPMITDGHCYRYLAHALTHGRITNPAPFPADVNADLIASVRPSLTGGTDRLFIQHPPGFAVLLALGVLAGLTPLVNPALHGVTVIAIYRLGARVRGEGVGRGAAALVAFSPMAIGWAGTHMSHTAGALAAVAFALAMFAAKRRGVAAPIVAGFALGVGIAIRPWSMILVAAPFAFAALSLASRRPRWFGPRLGLFAVGLAPPLVLWLCYNAAITGSPWTLAYSLLHGGGHDLGFGPRGFGAEDTHAPFTWFMGLEHTHYRLSVMPILFSAWPVPILLVAALALRRTESRRVRLLWWQFVALAVGYGLYFNRGDHVADLRFLLDAGPALAIVAAVGLASFTTDRARRIRALLLVTAAAFVLVAGVIDLGRFSAQMRGERGPADRAIARLGREQALLFIDRETYDRCCPISADPELARPLVVARASGVIDAEVAAQFPEKDVYYLTPSGTLYRALRGHDGDDASLLDQVPPERVAAARFHGRRNRGCVVSERRPWTVAIEAGPDRAVAFGLLYTGPPAGAVLSVRAGEGLLATLPVRRSGYFAAGAGFAPLAAVGPGSTTITIELKGPGTLTIVEPRVIDARELD